MVALTAASMPGYLKSQAPTVKLSLKQLTMKLVMFMPLLTGQRAHSLQLLDVRNMIRSRNNVVSFVINKLLKQTRPWYNIEPIRLKSYTLDSELCVVVALDVYVENNRQFRGAEKQIFISYQRPHWRRNRENIQMAKIWVIMCWYRCQSV